ncbi:Astra associated protein 1 Asa1 [Microbotryomycetes sp. JL201]|nr:Astra associated protein 1 Asa1 [Microbotryomycetes sp. JL201]
MQGTHLEPDASSNRSSTGLVLTAPPAPVYILRGHVACINALTFSPDALSLYSGDADGWVAIWDLITFRPRAFWKAHDAGVLTIEPLGPTGLVTHGRDNMVRHFTLPSTELSITRVAASAVPSPKNPTTINPDWQMDVNALAFSKMSLLLLSSTTTQQALVAVPALTKDELIDIFHLPSHSRIHRSIGADTFPIGDKTGTVMTLKLFVPPQSSSKSPLHLLAGYEDGRVAHFRFVGPAIEATEPPSRKRDEGQGWELIWDVKCHREAVMDLALMPDKQNAWSCGADHYLCKYNLFSLQESERYNKLETPYPGRSSLSVRDDGRLLAVTGWDGELRLYSGKTGKPLAVLSYHRSSLQASAFSPLPSNSTVTQTQRQQHSDLDKLDDSEDDMSNSRAWLAVGGKDERISLWEPYPLSE